MRKLFTLAILAITLFMTMSCQSIPFLGYSLGKRDAIEKQIVSARAETEAKLHALFTQQVDALNQSISLHEQREQAASNYLFKGLVTLSTIPTLTRPEMVINQSVQQAAAQLPAASPAAQAKAYQDLKTELDETKVSTEALKAQYEAELGKARAEGVAKDKALTDIATALKHNDDEKVDVLAQANAKERELGDKRKELSDKTIADKTREAEDAKSVQAIKIRVSSIVGGLGLLCLLGAIYTPIFRQQIGIAAGVFLLTAVVIWYIQPWMVGVTVGVILVALIAWMAKNHYIEAKTASNVYHAIQSVKDTAKADYDKVLAPALAAWQTKYDKAGNAIPDQAAIAHVDTVLMQTGAK